MKTLLISDFDGTLNIPCTQQKNAMNIEAIQRFREKGNLFAIATGRSLRSLSHAFPEWYAYTDFLITQDGAIGYKTDGPAVTQLFMFKIPNKETEHIAQVFKRRANRRFRDIVFMEGERELKKHRKDHCTKIRIWCSDAEDARSLHRIFAYHGYNVRSYYGIERESNHDLRRLSWIHDDMAHAVEISPRGVTKATAIKALKEHLDEDINIVTVGDDINDIEMIESFDGFAINPSPAMESHILPGHDACSLAEVIDKVSAL